jgi:hypothetical protein
MSDTSSQPVSAHATGRDRLRGHLAMVTFAALIAASFTLGKLALPYIDPVPFNAARFVIGSVLMGLVEDCITMEVLAPGMRDERTGKVVEKEYANWTTHPNNPGRVNAAE